MNSRLSQNTLLDEVEEVALSENSHGIKRFGKVNSYLDEAAGIS